jgi:hypothetical protein
MKLSITTDSARALHQPYFHGDFTSLYFRRSGFFDFPPASWFYGVGDLACWYGLLSTDGMKIVITRVKAFDHSSGVKTYELTKDDVSNMKVGTFKTRFLLSKSISGLTVCASELFLSVFMVITIVGVIPLLRRRKRFHIRPQDGLATVDEVRSLLKL